MFSKLGKRIQRLGLVVLIFEIAITIAFVTFKTDEIVAFLRNIGLDSFASISPIIIDTALILALSLFYWIKSWFVIGYGKIVEANEVVKENNCFRME